MRRRFLGNPVFDYTRYMTIESLEDGLFIQVPSAVEYTIDGTWKKLEANDSIEVNKGQFVSFKKTYVTGLIFGTFIINGRCNLRGNCMSMIFGDSGYKNNYLSGLYQPFHSMFKNCTGIVSVEPTFLPATTLADCCYENMFNGCTNLTTAPELPATTLAYRCYNSMFNGCTNLTTAPELSATTLADCCYEFMFDGCTSLVNAPKLPATTLTYYCYGYMFRGCTSLVNAPKLPATTLADSCYRYMFYGCTSLVTAPELPTTTLANYCYGYMFYGCTSLTTAPELPATTLTGYCYRCMFYNCTSLTAAPELPATTLARNCYERMFYGCSKLNYIKMLATNISASNCLFNWVYGVASTGTFVKNPAMTTLPTGYNGIPSGWTVVNDGEESGGGNVNSIFPMYLYTTKKDSTTYHIEPCDATLALVEYFWENAIESSTAYDLYLPSGSLFIDDWELDTMVLFTNDEMVIDFEVPVSYDGIRAPRGRLYVKDIITTNVNINKGLLEIYDEW